MYGKVFETMYTGSMVGKGSAMFAVWGYVIANMKPERVKDGNASGAHVELNHKLIAFILGEQEEVVERVITELCSPDPYSRTKEEGGRRLMKLGEYDYRVVNGQYYRGLRTVEERREYQRKKQAGYRARKDGLTPAQRAAQKLEADGQPEEADRLMEIDRNLREQS